MEKRGKNENREKENLKSLDKVPHEWQGRNQRLNKCLIKNKYPTIW